MRAILEFALFAWVAISVVAVVVQLVRLARFKRRQASAETPTQRVTEAEPPTIDLDARLAGMTAPEPAPEPEPAPVSVAAPPTIHGDTAPAPEAPAVAPEAPVVAAAPTASMAPPVAEPVEAAPSAPTLADLLSGVRLPGNLLPTTDPTQPPSDERVVLFTAEGEPGEIGADIADELERLGYEISTQGEDTALATRGDQKLGLRIIADPAAMEVDGVRRFPTATASSVALDVWIED